MAYRVPIVTNPADLPDHLAILNGAPSTDGVFAVSLDIDAHWVKTAYQRGLFPWYAYGQPVLWHSPNPRMVLPVKHFVCTHSLRKKLKQWARQSYLDMRVTVNHDFSQVIDQCATVLRPHQDGTWITDELKAAYVDLHRKQNAISVELWQGQTLQAGLYGVMIGKMFFGESMFTHVTDGSKVVLACWVEYLRRHDCPLIDCQQETGHLTLLGGAPIERQAFFSQSAALMQQVGLDFAQIQQQYNLLDFFR